MITDASSGNAVWLEANGVKRYCYGLPHKDSCSANLLHADPTPDNSKIG